MPALPPHADIDQLRHIAKDRLRAARAGDTEAAAWLAEVKAGATLSAAQLRLARDYGFPSWAALRMEVERRRVLDLRDAGALAAFIAAHPAAAAEQMENWRDHRLGASPLAYLAMSRYDTSTNTWRDVEGAGAAAHVLIAAGAPVDGDPDDRETPLITAASYGDADVAAVLIAAGADIDAVAKPNSGGVPGGSALLHAAVFGMTEVLDVLVAAGARVRSLEEAAAAGDITGWLHAGTEPQAKLRALIFAADHQRLDVIDQLVAQGTPIDDTDVVFGRQALRVAAANGREGSVRRLLALGANPTATDGDGLRALDHCIRGRAGAAASTGHNAVEAVLRQALGERVPPS